MSGGWDALNAAVAEARALVAAEAPDEAVAAEGEAYVSRVLAAALGGAVLGHLFTDDGLARALPVYGGPNPHYIMRHVGVDPSGRYRLEGQINGSERVGVGLYRPGANGGTPIEVGYAAFSAGDCGAEGRFALEDSRKAVLDARRAGQSVFAVTVDKDAKSYLPSMFGRNGFAIVGDIARLPQALPSIYRGLTR